LQPLFKGKRSFDYKIDKNSSLDFLDKGFFEICKINENSSLTFLRWWPIPTNLQRNLLIGKKKKFQRYQMPFRTVKET
jgi:hypothetical protein